MKNALIIFQKNPEIGKVKTRLAETIGNENALRIYEVLVEHTHEIVKALQVKKYLFFSNFIENHEKWADYSLKTQKGNDLGQKMFNAIDQVKNEGADQIVVIGTDCYELTEKIIQQAFDKLETHDYCLGPALDGGYYLIGTRVPDKGIFFGKTWSTNSVFKEAIASIHKIGKSVTILESLPDVDYEEDLKSLREFLI